MKFFTILLATLAFIASTTITLAHSPMKTTSPANEAKLNEVPKMLQLEFENPMRIMKVVMTHSTGDASMETRLELQTKDFVKEMLFTPDFMGPGAYKVEWRALGKDGHAMAGEFSFEVMAQ